VAENQLTVVGAMHDVATGRVTFDSLTESTQNLGEKMQKTARVVTLILFSSVVAAHVGAQDAPSSNMDNERSAIERAIELYVAAFNVQDAKAMAQFWSPDGVYISKLSGERVVGREAIATALAEIFAAEGKRQLEVSTESIEFISPNVALERGTSAVECPDQSTLKTTYRGIYVRRDGKWLIDRITEDESPPDDSRYQQLRELEWIIGDWMDQAGDDTIRIVCEWTKNRNYISRAYAVNVDGQINSSGLQIIGWDPRQKQIRSWLFDSNGGFVEGTWSQKGDRWFVQSVATLADGSAGSFTSIFRPLDQDNYSWQKVHRVVDGEIVPNIDEVVVVRQ
jgi:uncharacterized protein (TIGR02246 family)